MVAFPAPARRAGMRLRDPEENAEARGRGCDAVGAIVLSRRSRDRSCFVLRGLFPLKNAVWPETVTFCVFVAPPKGRSGNAFRDLLNIPPATCG